MSCEEVVTFRLDMSAPISLLSRSVGFVVRRSVARRVKSSHGYAVTVPELSSDPDKRALADLFSTTSARHDSVGGLFAHFGELLVERAALGPGDRVLDGAAGT